jgi:hypothetical protein
MRKDSVRSLHAKAPQVAWDQNDPSFSFVATRGGKLAYDAGVYAVGQVLGYRTPRMTQRTLIFPHNTWREPWRSSTAPLVA